MSFEIVHTVHTDTQLTSGYAYRYVYIKKETELMKHPVPISINILNRQ